MRFDEKAIARFWSHVDKSGDCWIWIGCKQSDGYGSVRINGKTIQAHRLSYEIAYGEIPTGIQILHRCDNPPCCNPNHLFSGTHTDNMRDMVSKHRHSFQIHPELVEHVIKTRTRNPSRGNNHYLRVHPEKVERLKGMNNPGSKLTDQQVLEIRNTTSETHVSIAKRYGVSRSLIDMIVSRKVWKHI